jgi:hypothetical protein
MLRSLLLIPRVEVGSQPEERDDRTVDPDKLSPIECISQAQYNTLCDLLDAHDVQMDEFKRYYHIAEVENLPQIHYEDAVAKVKKKPLRSRPEELPV